MQYRSLFSPLAYSTAGDDDDDDTYPPERHLRISGQCGHSPQRHTAAGTAAPSTTDTGNAVPQRANAERLLSSRTAPMVQNGRRGGRLLLYIQNYTLSVLVYFSLG